MKEKLIVKRIICILLFLAIFLTTACADSVIRAPYDLNIGELSLSGQYTGEVENGIPDGFGVFEAISPNKTAFHYIGQWNNGMMNGEGATYWEDGSLEIGRYQNGLFVSGKYNYNGLEMLKASSSGENTLNPYWLLPTRAAMDDTEESTVQYIGNKSSHVFHTLDCDSVRTMKEKNKVELFSREEAIEKKYKPCGRCSP